MNKYFIVLCVVGMAHMVHGADNRIAWDAKNYKQNSSLQYHFAQYALSQLSFVQNDRVLDVGCGDGKITRDIAQKVSEGLVKGIDLSADMIRQARVDHGDQTNLSFEVADAANFNVSQLFTKACALCSLSWVKDQENAYKNIANALEPQGKFVALVSNVNAHILQAYRSAFTYEKWSSAFKGYKPSYYSFTLEEVRGYLAGAGFDEIEVKNAEIPIVKKDKGSFLALLGGTPGVRDVIRQEDYENFLNDVMSEYLLRVPADVDGMIPIDCGLILVVAKRH